MADISKIKLPDETEVNLKDAQAFANIENDGQGGSSYTITRRDGTTKQVTIPNVTTTDPGLMTASDKTKIDTIEQGAEVNQQAFSKIRITKGSAHTDLDADTKTDTLELIEGDNITLTPSAVSDAVTIHAKDTVYTLAQDSTDGHIIVLTNNDEGSTDHVQTITIPDNNTTYTVSLNESTNEIVLTDSLGNTMKTKPSNASTSLDGFMSKSDKSKLDGIASGAEVNQNAFSNVIVDGTTISADSKTDTLTFIAGSNITITPNATNDSITISSSYTNTTYELTQDATDGHKFTLSGSNGYTKTITIPDNNTTYTLSVGTGTDANQIVFTPSSGSATKIIVPYATKALKDADGNVIKDTYAASFSISDHTITLKNKSGVSLGTVTVPDNNTTYTFAEGTTNKAFSVTPSGGSAQTVPIHGLGSASEKNFTTSVTSGSADLVTSGAVASAISTAIDNLPEPMIFKGTLGTNGTITSLPTASSSNEGWTYKVITAGTYASQAAKVGDMFVSAKIGSAYQWVYVPSGDDVEDTWRNIKVNGTEKLGTGISSGAVDFVDGDFINITYANNKITVSHADTSSQASVSNSGRTYIQSITLDGAGHVTKLTSATETVVNTDRYVNSASFADDTTASANSPVKMTLTRAGSDTATVTANIPKVSASSAGVAPKGASVSSQSQSTKFLREDGTWAKPSYTTNTDRYVNSASFAYDSTNDNVKMTLTRAGSDTATVTANIPLVSSTSAGVVKKGASVSTQSQTTKFLREDGTWATPSYTKDTNTTYTFENGTNCFYVTPSGGSKQTVTVTPSITNNITGSGTSGYLAKFNGANTITNGPALGSSTTTFLRNDGTWATPTDTNNAVTQTATNTNANYEVLFSGTADNTTRTEGARKYSNLTFNPSTGTLTTTKVVSANATLGVADIDTANITEDNVGNLIVTGAARFLNPINGVCTDGTSGTTKYMRQDGTWAVPPNDNTDTWRDIKVNTTEKLSTAISSGSVDFTDGNHINISFNGTGNKLTIAHADTSTQASVSNSGRTYIQSITLDGDGHVTGISSATETVTDTNTWRNIKINGTEKLTTVISSGAVDFVNGTNTTVNFNSTGNKISIDAVDTKYALDINGNNVILKKDGTTQDTITVPYATNAGTATSANKLSTARSIALGYDLAGSADFDGSGNITINATHYWCNVTGHNKANYPWHRFAYVKNKTGTYSDTDAIFDIRSAYNVGYYGRIKVSLRTNGSGSAITVAARWIYRAGFAIDDVKIAAWGTTGQAVYADVFIKCSTYPRGIVYEVEGSRAFTLVDSNEVQNTTATDPLTSVEVYKTIETAAIELHNQDYTTIVGSIDCATVDYANSAGNASTVNNLTVQTAVPANALFTDHTYNFSGTTFYSGDKNNSEHNADNIQYNGLYYYTSNGPSTSIGASTADGAIYAQAYSTAWVGQIAQDYRNGNLFTRGKNNGTWQAWRKVAYSDDTYSGTLTSTQVTTALGYTPYNPASGTYLPLSGGTLTGNLTISHAASATMTADSTNPKITFAENGSQPVHLIYSDYDSYRAPAGLKIIGGASATPAWFEVEGDIYETGTKLSAKYAPITNNAGYHNSIYRGKSLGTSITTAQWNAISAGTFDDLYIGDYWTLSTTINGTTSNINYVIAAFDYWWNCGDSYPQSSNKHHVVLVPSGYLYTAQMNTSNVTTGGYISSAMYTTNLTAARTGISNLFGDHLYSVRRLFTTAVNASGQATGWGWYTSSVDLMNENMVYGSSVWTTSGYEVGVDRNILPLFLLNPASASIRANWWLRSVATPATFALVTNGGFAGYNGASNSYGVRPAFAIY